MFVKKTEVLVVVVWDTVKLYQQKLIRVPFLLAACVSVGGILLQTDHALLKALVERFGSLRYFVASPAGDQAYVSFVHVEDAVQAHRALSAGVPGGLPQLIVEFVSDVDVQAAVMTAGYSGAQPTDASWQLGLGTVFAGGGAVGSMWSSGAGVEDHSSFLPSDLFSGGQ